MTPDSLRILSLRLFKATVYCAIVGIALLVAVPNPSFRAAAEPAARMIGIAAFAFLAIAVVTNLASLLVGAAAWMKGSKRCPWIFASVLVFLVPGGIWVAARLNL